MITNIYNIDSGWLREYVGNKKRKSVFIITVYEDMRLVCYYDDVYDNFKTQWLNINQIEENGWLVREQIQQDLAYLWIKD